MDSRTQSRDVEELLARFRNGDGAARDELINLSYDRFLRLARRMLDGYPRLRRYMETGDVLNGAMSPLLKALGEIRPESPDHYFRLGALQIRRQLLDLTRRYFGPYGVGANHDTGATPPDETPGPEGDPVSLSKWTEFHEAVESLPNEQREAVDLLWYQGLTQDETARLLGVDVRTVKRRWRAARLALGSVLGGPDEQAGGVP